MHKSIIFLDFFRHRQEEGAMKNKEIISKCEMIFKSKEKGGDEL